MTLLGNVQVAWVLAAVVFCSCCPYSTEAQQFELGCAGSQLDDIVRRISKTRFESRDAKPKLARCKTFVSLIQGQHELGLAMDEPRNLLSQIDKILDQRARCPGQPMGGLITLREFVEDCQELMELASGKPEVAPSQESPEDTARRSQGANDDEMRSLRDSLVSQSEVIRKLEDENVKLASGQKEQQRLQVDLQAQLDKVRELEAENAKLSSEIDELRRASNSVASSVQAKEEALRELSDKSDRQARELNELRALNEHRNSMLEATRANQGEELKEALAKIKKLEGEQQALSGSVREIELQRDQNGKVGLVWGTIWGGVFIKQTTPGSPAARAGIRFGDQLLEVNGRSAAGNDIVQLMNLSRGQPIKFKVRKSPFLQEFVLKKRPDEEWGMMWSYDARKVNQVDGNSAASRAGIIEGLRIIAMNGKSVIGMWGNQLTGDEYWGPAVSETRVTLMPESFYDELVNGMCIRDLRDANSKIAADEKGQH